ncbi:hypothetical protein MPSEU_000162600 [Mayamaea pseudoterrestris]|nr:hypothetical protein MPSEU_000162600 [Mayamaea pseudoterrestris]
MSLTTAEEQIMQDAFGCNMETFMHRLQEAAAHTLAVEEENKAQDSASSSASVAASASASATSGASQIHERKRPRCDGRESAVEVCRKLQNQTIPRKPSNKSYKHDKESDPKSCSEENDDAINDSTSMNEILTRTEQLFRNVQQATRSVTVRDILTWLQADFGVELVKRHKLRIKDKLLELVNEQAAAAMEQGNVDSSDEQPPAAFPLPAPREVIDLLDDSDEEQIEEGVINDGIEYDDDDDSVQLEKTMSCIQVVQSKYKQALAANQVICLE